MTTTFMTNIEYAKYKGYDDWDGFIAVEEYPTAGALDLFREDVFGWMIGQIGNEQARTAYGTNEQFKLRNIEYRAVELMISGEIEKDKVENYIADSIMVLFGEKDDAELEVIDNEIHRGVV